MVIKAHRTPVDLEAAQAAIDAQHTLAAAGFPCPVPLAGPDEVDGRVLTAETLITGARPNGRLPAARRLLADGLAQQIKILAAHPNLTRRAGAGPSWCRYQGGPWPVPHDTLVDFPSTVAGFEWLETFAQRAADQILDNRTTHEVVVGHADWYAGNTAVVDGRLVGVFDWELVADTEAVIAGFTASCYASSATGSGGFRAPSRAQTSYCWCRRVTRLPTRSACTEPRSRRLSPQESGGSCTPATRAPHPGPRSGRA